MDKTLTLKLAPATEDQFERLLEIQERSNAAEQNSIRLSRHDLVAMQSWKRMGADGLQVICDDQTIVGMLRYIQYLDARSPTIAAVITVDPESRDEGIADWAYEQVLVRARQDGAVCLDTIIDHRDRDAREFLLRRGFEELVTVWTLEAAPDFAPAEAPQPPDGFQLRTYELKQDAALVAELFNRTFERHKSFAPATAAEMQSIEDTPAFDPALTFFLESKNGEAVGYARNTLRGDRKDGWIDMLGVVPESQGKGFGRFLLLQCMYVLARARPRAIRLSVEGTNERARTMYDSEGFMEIRVRVRYRKNLSA